MQNCQVCNEPLDPAGDSTATVHYECACCTCCLEPLGKEFYEVKGSFLCREDYFLLHGQRCAYGSCGEVIHGKVISGLGKTWHESHFTCASCGVQLATASFVARHSHAFCIACNTKMKSLAAKDSAKPECAKCNRPIQDPANEMTVFKNQTVHASHFDCFVCGCALDAKCKELDGRLVCPAHAESGGKGTCKKCAKTVRTERNMVALGGIYHLECFVCTKCETPFPTSSFWEIKGDPYCEVHYNQWMGSICGHCNDVSTGRVVTAMGRKWCEDHFFCHTCFGSLVNSKFVSWDAKPVCKKCYDVLPRSVRQTVHRREEAEKKRMKAGIWNL
ncbi:hypothetical protein BJ741DRAFT_631537, partial [Chytriomyces cf. hyalinus JEL632]